MWICDAAQPIGSELFSGALMEKGWQKEGRQKLLNKLLLNVKFNRFIGACFCYPTMSERDFQRWILCVPIPEKHFKDPLHSFFIRPREWIWNFLLSCSLSHRLFLGSCLAKLQATRKQSHKKCNSIRAAGWRETFGASRISTSMNSRDMLWIILLTLLYAQAHTHAGCGLMLNIRKSGLILQHCKTLLPHPASVWARFSTQQPTQCFYYSILMYTSFAPLRRISFTTSWIVQPWAVDHRQWWQKQRSVTNHRSGWVSEWEISMIRINVFLIE